MARTRSRESLIVRLERGLSSVFGPAQLGDPREPPVQRPGEPPVVGEWERVGPPGARYLVRREQPAEPAPPVATKPPPRLIPHEDVTRREITAAGEAGPAEHPSG